MSPLRKLQKSLSTVQEILQASLPDVKLQIDPIPGPAGCVDVLIAHTNGRRIRCHMFCEDQPMLAPPALADLISSCMRCRGWPDLQ